MKCITCGWEPVLVLKRFKPLPDWLYAVYYCTECKTRWEVLTKK